MFFRTALVGFALCTSTLAFAGDAPNQTTSYGSANTATRLDLMEGQLAGLQAKQAAAQTAYEQSLGAMNSRINKLKTVNATAAQVAADPELGRIREMVEAQNQVIIDFSEVIIAFQDAIDGKVSQSDFDALVRRVTDIENTPVVSNTTNNVVTNNIVNNPPPVASGKTEHRSGTQFTLGIGQTLIFSDTLEGELYGVRTRTDFSGRVGLEVGKFNPAFDANFGLGSSGFSFNGLITVFKPVDRTNIALGVGPQYACDRFWDDGECNVERVGVLSQFSTATSLRGGAWGLSLRSGIEVSHYLNNDNGTGYTGVQVRATFGAGLYIGRSAKHGSNFR